MRRFRRQLVTLRQRLIAKTFKIIIKYKMKLILDSISTFDKLNRCCRDFLCFFSVDFCRYNVPTTHLDELKCKPTIFVRLVRPQPHVEPELLLLHYKCSKKKFYKACFKLKIQNFSESFLICNLHKQHGHESHKICWIY